MASPTDSGTAWSPDISGELLLHGQLFKVAALASDTVVVHSPRAVEAGRGILRLELDGHVTVYPVEMAQGIDPGRLDQPFHRVGAADEAAA